MLLIDAHLDLAMNALQGNRDSDALGLYNPRHGKV